MPWRAYLIRALPRHPASLDAELVPLRIVHAHPVLTILLDGATPVAGAERPESGHLRVHPGLSLLQGHCAIAPRVEVDVHAVLCDLGFRDALEVHARAGPIRVLGRCPVIASLLEDTLCRGPFVPAGEAVWRRFESVVQGLRPEGGLARRIGAVEDNLDARSHPLLLQVCRQSGRECCRAASGLAPRNSTFASPGGNLETVSSIRISVPHQGPGRRNDIRGQEERSQSPPLPDVLELVLDDPRRE